MRQALIPHPDHPSLAATSIEVAVERPGSGALTLHFFVTGSIDDLFLPPAAAARADGLWQHTCLEAFVRTASDAGYYEFNFAPSMRWAAYHFSGYRSGRSDLDIAPPLIETRVGDGCYELRAEVEGLPDGPWQVGLSAIIEETDGRKSYWALAHPPGKADFHRPESFALELPAVSP